MSGLVTPHSRPGTPSGLATTTGGSSSGGGDQQQQQSQPDQSSLTPLSASTQGHSISRPSSAAAAAAVAATATSSHSSSKPSVPSYERSIYEQFMGLYKSLLEIKNNRNKYIDSKQVYSIYDTFLDAINELKLTRKDEELKGMKLDLPNSNDSIIDDIFQLLSLCFVTCGLIKFAPATYSSLSTVMKLLTHLKECKVYTMADLEPVGQRLSEISEIILSSQDKYAADDDEEQQQGGADGGKLSQNHQIEENLLRNKLNKCENLFKELVDNFENIPHDLEPIYHALIDLRHQLLTFVTDFSGSGDDDDETKRNQLKEKISGFKNELKQIEKLRDESDGKFHSSEVHDEHQLDSIQAVLNGLIDDCNNLISDLLLHDEAYTLESLEISDDASPELKKQYDQVYKSLQDMKATLENILLTRRWTLRETDLYNYQKTLKTIDDSRIKIFDQTPKGTYKKYQTLILYLLRKCYSIVYKLLESSEPVSESLAPIHNQLQTVKRCLLELKRVDGLNNLRELYPFQFKLASIDNLRKDGKFIIHQTVPEGQGAVCALLSECFDILQEMKIDLEEKELEDEDDEEEEEEEDENEGAQNAKGQTNNDEEGAGTNNDPTSGGTTTTTNGAASPTKTGKVAISGSFTNSKESGEGGLGTNSEVDDVELKRNRFKEFNEADYDVESESAFGGDYDDDDDALSINDSEVEGNDYY
ncbi:unnamed protein product [Candida parapsilosis]|uniref:Uncharacterized protein n=1 Tax=Candida parapsilosis (strain CDC 317 / ATCC MYA-4646) TaxID=578454 RepID=G8BCD0_CANPC|nr:uncharacterized protein CPAR2_803450 [Candida parapsilosis]CCE41795.1 hypothetical protein CPAR2_803450 [Candida parapsilosis]